MKIIVPMAGRGKRMRPHSLTTPKPLIPVTGKPIVQNLVEDIAALSEDKVEEIAFIIGDFGQEVEEQLRKVAEGLGAKGSIYHQEEALGTAHALLCAQESLSGNVIVAFADTLFIADFKLDTHQDGIVWVQRVEDPSNFGVVKLNDKNEITDFVEKPEEPISDKAIIGIYYFKDGEFLRNELQYLIDNNIKDKGEYQLTNALENMKNKGAKFVTGQVDEWLDCGNYRVTIKTHQRYIAHKAQSRQLIDPTAKQENSVIIPPVYMGPGAVVRNSVIGPHVSIGEGSTVEDSRISNSIIQNHSQLREAFLRDSLVSNEVTYQGRRKEVSIGDFTEISE